jgi:hypothetical protein
MYGYYYLSNQQIKTLLNALKTVKDSSAYEIASSLKFQSDKNDAENSKFRLAAANKLTKIDSKSYNNQELLVDDDALVSSTNTGAYVHCWLWVDNDVKPKRTRKKVQ